MSMSIPVFRNSKWISYTVPSDVDTLWSTKSKLQAASVYATAIEKGFSPSYSAILAESYVNKQLYLGLQYNAKIEKTLESFLV